MIVILLTYICSVYYKKILERVSGGSIELHSSIVSYFGFDVADVHLVSLFPGALAAL